jgi:SAM-dependent methyltransferase
MEHNSFTLQIYTNKGRSIPRNSDKKIYNLGCGKQNYSGVIGVDRLSLPHIAIQCDLNKYPWPIIDNSADIILAFHFLEHTDDLVKIFEEIYRIAKPAAHVIVEIPYFRSPGAFQDPTHKHYFTTRTIQYFCRDKTDYFGQANFNFKHIGTWIGWPAKSRNPLVNWFKNWCLKHQDFYDTYLSLLFPAKILVHELRVLK